jgi:cell division cycle 2-like
MASFRSIKFEACLFGTVRSGFGDLSIAHQNFILRSCFPPLITLRARLSITLHPLRNSPRMASKASKWASAPSEEDAAASAQRKAEKAQRKRQKEARTTHGAETIDENNDPPAKRQRTTTTTENDTAAEGAHILSFPVLPIAPANSVSQFDLLNAIEEGSYGLVSRARRQSTGTLVALKKLKIDDKNNSEGFPVTGLREIQTLKSSRHANIVELQEVVMGESLKE